MGGERTRNANGSEASPAELQAEIGRLSTKLARAERRIAELEERADIDPLLDILNRRGFERAVNRSLAYIQRYRTQAALLFIDLDGFKTINDCYGHATGDALLRKVATALTGHVRASDLVGRLGGDEFGVLLWHIENDKALRKARGLEVAIESAGVTHGGTRLTVGASAGMVLLDPSLDTGGAIDAADRAMYARKRERRASSS